MSRYRSNSFIFPPYRVTIPLLCQNTLSHSAKLRASRRLSSWYSAPWPVPRQCRTKPTRISNAAIRLLQYDKEISSIPEPELRIPLRFSILEFIYSKEVRSQYVSAEPVLTAFFDDVETREKALTSGFVAQKNQMALLLRKYNREAATAVEAKYGFEPNTSEDDLKQFQTPADPTEVIDRAITNLRKYGYSITFTNLYERIRRGSPELGTRMMVATLEYVEKDPTPVNARWLNLVMVDVLNPPQPVVTASNARVFTRY